MAELFSVQLKNLEANSTEQITQLQECLKQSEADRDAVSLKLHKSEANNQVHRCVFCLSFSP